MTKFEEKLEILPIKIIQHPVGDTKYYAAVHVKSLISQADEEFQELLEQNAELTRENNIVNQINSKLESQVANLKSQLQQQSLPVVPEFVAEFIESYKDRRTIYGVFDKISKNRKTYPKLYEWVFEDENSQTTFALAFITGKYQVEKPQLFYLKNKLTGAYLYYDEATKLYSDIVGNVEDFFGTKTKFTEAEIGSMETGSYELVPVEDGE